MLVEKKYLILKNEIIKIKKELNLELENYNENKTIDEDFFYFEPIKLLLLPISLIIFVASFYLGIDGLSFLIGGVLMTILLSILIILEFDIPLMPKKLKNINRIYKHKKMKQDKRYKLYILKSKKDFNEMNKKNEIALNKIKKINMEIEMLLSKKSLDDEEYHKAAIDLILKNKIPEIEESLIEYNLTLSDEIKNELKYRVEKRNMILS